MQIASAILIFIASFMPNYIPVSHKGYNLTQYVPQHNTVAPLYLAKNNISFRNITKKL